MATEKKDQQFTTLAREFELKDNQPDYAELQWYRGFWAGIKFLLDTPTLDAKKLERAAQREHERT